MKQGLYCAILGHSPMRFKWGFDEEDIQCKNLKLELVQQIMTLRQFYRVANFVVAGDPGVGLYAAEAIHALRKSDDTMMLLCMTPHEEQATKWAPYLRERYFTMLENCTYMSTACKTKTPSCQYEAFEAIINRSNMVLSVYDPSSYRGDDVDKAMEYAVKRNKQIVLIHPDRFEVTSYPNNWLVASSGSSLV